MMPMRKTSSMIFLGAVILLFDLMLLIPPSSMVCGLTTSQNVFHARHCLLMTTVQQRRRRLNSVVESGGSELSSSLDEEEGEEDDVDEASVAKQQQQPKKELDVQERVWRFVKKPLLNIGSKGAANSHGNSLRQLLDDHTVVKVKVNTRKYGGSLENAATALKELAIENGAPDGIEIIQMREKAGNLVLYGIPGTLQRMDEGTFPPPPPPPPKEDDETMAELSP